MSWFNWLFGRPLASEEQEQQQIGPLTGIPVLGLDALASAAYGPEAALTLLIPLGAVALHYIVPISVVIASVLVVVYFSYRQTINGYPGGGGSYTVAKENLGTLAGLTAGAALALDYVLNVAVGISAGVGALVSAVPSLLPHTLALCVGILLVLTMVNLRGIRESGIVFLAPTYVFVISLATVVFIGAYKTIAAAGHPTPIVGLPRVSGSVQAATLWIVLRAFASGCTAMTGVEAVSNGVPVFRSPTVVNAKRTLTAIVAILGGLLLGIAYLSHAYNIQATEPGQATYQSLLSMLVGAVMGRGAFYYTTMVAIVCVLALSANTSFADFPRLCRVLAEDHYLPDSFAMRGRRLVYSRGIVALAVVAGALLVTFDGVTDRLIPLFAIGAFLAFTMSQAGMVAHWRRTQVRGRQVSLLLNAVGAAATGLTLVVVGASKFVEGAWITIVCVPLLVALFQRINRHYASVARQITTTEAISGGAFRGEIAVVAVQSWNKLTKRGLELAMQLSPEVHAVQVKSETAKMRDLTAEWPRIVEEPTRAAGRNPPKLVLLSSNYRQFFQPLLDYVFNLRDTNPTSDIVVIIPDLIINRWYHGFLHNHRGTILRELLRLRGGDRVIVVTTPFHLRD